MKGALLHDPPVTVDGAPAVAVARAMELAGLSDSVLQERLSAAFGERRRVDASIARLSGEVLSRSRPSLGPDGLARRNGNTDATGMVAQIGRITRAEAGRLCRVGDATAIRVSLTGELLPPVLPLVAAAFDAAELPVDSVQHIITQLGQAAPRADVADLLEAERALVEYAQTAAADDVRAVATRWRDTLDVDGIEPREEALIAARSLERVLLPNGMKRFVLDLDPLNAAFVDTAVDAEVTATIRKVRFVDETATGDLAEIDPRTLAQVGADVIVDLARHALSCADTTAPLAAATVVVRMNLDALISGLGAASIDGGGEPISAGAARCLAAEADIIPMVLGGDSEVLDLGRAKRHFSRAPHNPTQRTTTRTLTRIAQRQQGTKVAAPCGDLRNRASSI